MHQIQGESSLVACIIVAIPGFRERGEAAPPAMVDDDEDDGDCVTKFRGSYTTHWFQAQSFTINMFCATHLVHQHHPASDPLVTYEYARYLLFPRMAEAEAFLMNTSDRAQVMDHAPCIMRRRVFDISLRISTELCDSCAALDFYVHLRRTRRHGFPSFQCNIPRLLGSFESLS